MASLIQGTIINKLISEHDWKTIGNPEYKDLDPMDVPIGGPVVMETPDGELFQVYADGSVVPYN